MRLKQLATEHEKQRPLDSTYHNGEVRLADLEVGCREKIRENANGGGGDNFGTAFKADFRDPPSAVDPRLKFRIYCSCLS